MKNSKSDAESIIAEFLQENITQTELEQSLKSLEERGLLQTKINLDVKSPNFQKEIKEKLFSKEVPNYKGDFVLSSNSAVVSQKFFWGGAICIRGGIFCMPYNAYVGHNFWSASIMCTLAGIWDRRPTYLVYRDNFCL